MIFRILAILGAFAIPYTVKAQDTLRLDLNQALAVIIIFSRCPIDRYVFVIVLMFDLSIIQIMQNCSIS